MDNLQVDFGVWPSFGLPQTSGPAAPFRFLQARETLGFIEVEVLVRHDALETQKVLDAAHFPSWVTHQSLSADKEKFGQREVTQPVVQMLHIKTNPHRTPRGINETHAQILEGQVLEAGDGGVFGKGLSVVRNGPGHRVANHHDQLGVSGHIINAPRGFLGHKITWGFLHGDLSFQGPWHQVSVGIKAIQIPSNQHVPLVFQNTITAGALNVIGKLSAALELGAPNKSFPFKLVFWGGKLSKTSGVVLVVVFLKATWNFKPCISFLFEKSHQSLA